MTTRPARPAEVEGVDRYFVDRDRFRAAIAAGEMLEWAVYNDNYYGTPAGPVLDRLAKGENVLLEIEVQGAAQVKSACPDAILVFISPPSLAALAERLATRGDTTDIEDRLEIARREMEVADELFDHVVVNDDLDEAVTEVLGILRAS
jgi:guanylate kinase